MPSLPDASALLRRIATNVRATRQKLGLSQKGAAEAAEMHWRHWQKVEAAEVNVTAETLVRLGAALRTDPSRLLAEPG